MQLQSIESHLLPWEVMKSRLKVKRRIQETIKYYVSKLAEHHW